MQCPYCKEEVLDGAIKCKHCSSSIGIAAAKAQSMIWDSEDANYICVKCPRCSKEAKIKTLSTLKTETGYKLNGEGACSCGLAFDTITKASTSISSSPADALHYKSGLPPVSPKKWYLTWKGLLLLLVVLLVFSNIFTNRVTQTSTKTEVAAEKEPTIFLGIKLGEPIAGQMKPCPSHKDYIIKKGLYVSDWEKTKEICYDDSTDGPIQYELHNLPQVIPWRLSSLLLNNGNVEGIDLGLRHDDYNKIRGLFIEKYGRPTHSDKSEYKNRMGATFIGEKLFWQWKNLSMTMIEYSGSYDLSQIYIATEKYSTYLKNKKRNENIKNLEKL
ncbi:MAG: hypothetical protein WCP10_04635 [Desulfuromonadales bacterium]